MAPPNTYRKMSRNIVDVTAPRAMSCGVRTNCLTVRPANDVAVATKPAPPLVGAAIGVIVPSNTIGVEPNVDEAVSGVMVAVMAGSFRRRWRRWRWWVGGLVGGAAGERQEDLVERRAAEADVVDVDVLLGKRADRVGDGRWRLLLATPGPGLDTDGNPAVRLVDRRRLVAESGEHLGRGGEVGGVAHPDLDPVATGLALELARRARGDRLAVVDDHDVVGELVGLLEVLRRQQHVGAGGDERPDRVPQLDAAARVETGCRLVEQQQAWCADEAGAEVEAAAHAARVAAHETIGRVVETELLEDVVGGDPGGRTTVPEEAGDHDEVLAPGQRAFDGGRLAGQADRLTNPLRFRHRIDTRDEQLPSSGRWRVATARTNVVLPAPFGPRTAVTWPAGATRSRPSSAMTALAGSPFLGLPNRLTRPDVMRRWRWGVRNSYDHFARRNWSPPVHFVVGSWTRESRSSRRHLVVPPVPWSGDRGRAGRRARGVGEDGPPRPRGAVDGGDSRVPAGRPQRRLAAARRIAHRPEWAHPDRGPDPVHGRRPGVDGDARGQGRVAQARAGAPGDVPGRRRAGGVVRRARRRVVGGRADEAAGVPGAAAASRRRRRAGEPRLRRPDRAPSRRGSSIRWVSSRRARRGT